MDLNTAIKEIVRDYLANESLSDLVYGTWGASSVKIDDKPVPVPMDMISVPKGTTISIGDRVSMLQGHKGQKYAVIGVLQ